MKLNLGIVAHVDAGKTTLSEALLYEAGKIRQLGRVDKGEAFLDTFSLEKQRGMTIFSHAAQLNYKNLDISLLDTPGHVDFASQTEQVLSVLDYAILLVAGNDGVKGYTRTLWRLLERYNVPTFIFVNKMDMDNVSKPELLAQLKEELSPWCTAFSKDLKEDTLEEISLSTEESLDEFLETETLKTATIKNLIQERKIFPCYFGSALKLQEVETLLNGLAEFSKEKKPKKTFSGKVFKISHDEKGERLTWIKVTGGTLSPRDTIGEEKINQLRLYHGEKYSLLTEATFGQVCAVTGLKNTFSGLGLGEEKNSLTPFLQPAITYTVMPKENELSKVLEVFAILEDEDPQLQVNWSKELKTLQVSLMGEVQLEILRYLLKERFSLDVTFDEGHILYKETIGEKVEGVGHFEPLRHYAEVHLLLEPDKNGSGVTFSTDCSVDILKRPYQQQVLNSLKAKTHLGVLTGSSLTDVSVTLINGRGHLKHTEGGDFKEATWRALRQGLMMLREKGQVILLEPWYDFRLEIPEENLGKALYDLQERFGKISGQERQKNRMILKGQIPVATMQNYSQVLRSYSHGKGELECVFSGYYKSHNPKEISEKMNYHPTRDLANSPDSVFCSHGAGYPVTWSEVPKVCHVPYTYESEDN